MVKTHLIALLLTGFIVGLVSAAGSAIPARADQVIHTGPFELAANYEKRKPRVFSRKGKVKPRQDPRIDLDLGRMKLTQGKEAEALPLLQRAAAAMPERAEPYRLLGVTHFKAGRYGEAIVPLRHALLVARDIDPSLARALGIAYVVMGEFAKAVTVFQLGLEEGRVTPNLEMEPRWLAEWLIAATFATGDNDDAKAARRRWSSQLHEADDVASVSSSRLCDAADMAYENSVRYGALRGYTVCLSALKRHWFKVGGERRKRTREKADQVLEKIVRLYREIPLRPALPPAAYELAEKAATAVNSGNVGDAQWYYRRALEEAPWWADGYFNAALVDAVAWSEATAIDTMKVYLRLEPGGRFAQRAHQKIALWTQRLDGLIARGAHVDEESGLVMTPDNEEW